MRPWSNALIVVTALSLSIPAPATAQALETGDRVRVTDSSGERVMDGVVEEITSDALALRGDSLLRLSSSALREARYQVSVQNGTKAGSAALALGALGGAVGFAFGYCFQLFAEGCAEDVGSGLQAGAVLGIGGAFFGALLGSTIKRYEPIAPRAFAPNLRPEIVTGIGPDGRVTFGASLRFH